ncbi:unnamed protein product [Cuscuta campestris]|uniref:Alpha/beta hydrolase fold-3 domain-containing protein n=1 Tax=Cuscuta campestris TaxID=132261 RepID=A0A484MAT4_9ASTE|nr:unnamed protein product [Cuscuta campestris]
MTGRSLSSPSFSTSMPEAGRIHFSVADAMVNESCELLCSATPAIVVTAQYEDVLDAVAWVRDQAAASTNGEKWLNDFGDFSRCYPYGVSNGANVAYNAALLAQERDLRPLNMAGLILNQPLFEGKERTESEMKLATHEKYILFRNKPRVINIGFTLFLGLYLCEMFTK